MKLQKTHQAEIAKFLADNLQSWSAHWTNKGNGGLIIALKKGASGQLSFTDQADMFVPAQTPPKSKKDEALPLLEAKTKTDLPTLSSYQAFDDEFFIMQQKRGEHDFSSASKTRIRPDDKYEGRSRVFKIKVGENGVITSSLERFQFPPSRPKKVKASDFLLPDRLYVHQYLPKDPYSTGLTVTEHRDTAFRFLEVYNQIIEGEDNNIKQRIIELDYMSCGDLVKAEIIATEADVPLKIVPKDEGRRHLKGAVETDIEEISRETISGIGNNLWVKWCIFEYSGGEIIQNMYAMDSESEAKKSMNQNRKVRGNFKIRLVKLTIAPSGAITGKIVEELGIKIGAGYWAWKENIFICQTKYDKISNPHIFDSAEARTDHIYDIYTNESKPTATRLLDVRMNQKGTKITGKVVKEQKNA